MMQLQDRNQKHRKDWGRQSAYFGMFLALSLIFSYVETLIPISFGIPEQSEAWQLTEYSSQ